MMNDECGMMNDESGAVNDESHAVLNSSFIIPCRCWRRVMMKRVLLFVAAICLAAQPAGVRAQPPQAKPTKTSAKKPTAEVDPMAEIRRTTAIYLVNTLADDARTFRDPVLRSRVQARAADALWDTDKERARALFRRAWDEAEAADDEADRRVEEEKQRQMREPGTFA